MLLLLLLAHRVQSPTTMTNRLFLFERLVFWLHRSFVLSRNQALSLASSAGVKHLVLKCFAVARCRYILIVHRIQFAFDAFAAVDAVGY